MSLFDKMDIVKKEFPKVLKDNLGNVTDTCNMLGCARSWYYAMRHEDPEFKALCDEAHEVVIDFVESHLFKQIKADVPSSTIFFLKTRAKDRGYIERNEFSGKDGGPIQVEQLNELETMLADRIRQNIIAENKALEASSGDNGLV
jgi:hypothetical protein